MEIKVKVTSPFCNNCGLLIHIIIVPVRHRDWFGCKEFSGRSVLYQISAECPKCGPTHSEFKEIVVSAGTHDHDSDDIEELTDWQLDLS